MLAAVVASIAVLSPRSAKDRYLEVEAKNSRKYIEQMKKDWQRFYDFQLPYLSGSYKKRMEIQGNSDALPDIINKCKLIINTENNYEKKQSVTALSLLIRSTPLFDVNAVTSERIAYLSVPLLLPDRYLSVGLDNADEVYDKFGFVVRPSGFVILPDIAAAVSPDWEGLGDTIAAYGDLIKSQIKNEDVRYGGNVQVSSPASAEVKRWGREIIVTLEKTRAQDLFEKLAARAAGDDALIRLVFRNLENVASLFADYGYFNSLLLLNEYGYIKLSPEIQNVISFLASAGSPGFMDAAAEFVTRNSGRSGGKFAVSGACIMKIAVDNGGNIIDREFELPLIDESKDEGFTIKVHSRYSFHMVEIIRSKAGGGSITSRYGAEPSLPGKGTDADGIEGIRIFAQTQENGAVVDSAETVINISERKNDKQKTLNRDVSIDIMLNAQKYNLKIAEETKFGWQFDMPQIDRSKTIDLNTLTEDGKDKLMTDILASFGSFYFKNKEIFDAFLGVGK